MSSTLSEQDMLYEGIHQLIHLRQEGGYWDYKKEWYVKKSDLLHDIICMANNMENHDAYIIIGVDEYDDCSIVDVRKDENRRNTQNVVDFLKDKKFAGGIRPTVYVQSFGMNGGEIDVIIIANSHHTPFYLTERYENVRENYIYTRIMDTNTPVDRSADVNKAEYLWRKRFYLDETPLERFRHYLIRPEDWKESPAQWDMGKYYKYAPEFTIKDELDESRNGYEFYVFGFPNTRPSWYDVTLCYHQTALEQFTGVSLDGGRCYVIAPDSSGISFSEYLNWDVAYSYYVVGTLRHRLLLFFQGGREKEATYQFHRFMKCVLVFDSIYEQEQFEHYVRQRRERYEQLYKEQQSIPYAIPHFPELKGYNMDAFKKDWIDAAVLQIMLDEFRNRDD